MRGRLVRIGISAGRMARLGPSRAAGGGIGRVTLSATRREQFLRIRDRGLHRAELAVEECNPRARALYERLGYVAYGSKPKSRAVGAEGGSTIRYQTMCTLMRKELR